MGSMIARLSGLLVLTSCAVGCVLQQQDIGPGAGQVSAPVMGGSGATSEQIYGTLIAETVVLTAAHCIKHQNQQGTFTDDFKPSEVAVLAGELHAEGPVVASLAHAVSKVVSADFDGDFEPDPVDNPEGLAHANDIALLLLHDPVDEIEVTPILPFSQLDEKLPPKSTLLINGYGLNDNDPNNSIGGSLHIAEIPVSGRNDYELAGGGHGVDTCPGDSGGPAYFQEGSKTYLVGVTSRGAANAINPLCGDGTVFTLAPAYVDWITKNAGGAYPPPVAPPPEEDDGCSLAHAGRDTKPSAGWLLMFAALLCTVTRSRRLRCRPCHNLPVPWLLG